MPKGEYAAAAVLLEDLLLEVELEVRVEAALL